MSNIAIRWHLTLWLALPAYALAGEVGGPPLSDRDWGTQDNGIAQFAFDAGGGLGDYGSSAVLLPDGRLLMAGIAQLDNGPGGDSRFDVAHHPDAAR